MQVLVTGVTGVLGRAVARRLVAAGHAVSGVARHPHPYLDAGVEFVCAPLGGAVLKQLADESDVVVHLAPIEPGVPGSAGINSVVRVAHAAARAGARLIVVSQAAGQAELYRQAEALVSTGWAPSLIVRTAPPVGRQLDWMVSRTVAGLLRANDLSRPLRVVHVDDLVRFVALAATVTTTGTVDLATPDTTHVVTARRLLRSVDLPPRVHRLRDWPELIPDMDLSALQEDWQFELGWRATDAVADTARGLAGRRLGANGATDLPGRLPLPLEVPPRTGPVDGAALECAAPDGLEAEFDDRIDPRFPVFSAAPLAGALPGPLTPMTLDVQLAGLRAANRVLAQAMALGPVVAGEWENRAVAVFGHRPYVGVSASVLAADQLPGWDARTIVGRALGERPAGDVVPPGRPPLSGGLPGAAGKAVVGTRSLALVRHLKAETQAYTAAATAEHLDASQVTALTDAALEVRIGLLRARIHQGWALTALWVIDNGVTAAALERTGAPTAISGLGALVESQRIAAEAVALADVLRGDPRALQLAAHGDVDGVRALSPRTAGAVDAALARIGHRGPGEAELANPTFGDDPALLLTTAAATPRESAPDTPGKLAERLAAKTRLSREHAHDVTMRYTHELRMALRESGRRLVGADLVDSADDVFYLTCDELLAMPADTRLRIKRRRAERERLQALRLPDVIDRAWRPVTVS
ncbi:NAD-dependent epimerase/dehydratase family protein [Mycobacterium sp.]|uniref:NAD-dependent epimerase/dehydratase family protein n=1 Tax=Mycobacterium sp. TaxID=1785 RepID=UPI0031DAF720